MKDAIISKSLSCLRSLAEDLNRASDQLTEALLQTEKALAAIRLGIEVSLEEPILKETDWLVDEKTGRSTEGPDWELYLGYGRRFFKSKNDWSIYVDIFCCGEIHSTRRISELSRDQRILVADHLPELLDFIASKAKETLEKVKIAKVSVETATQTLDG